MNNSQTRALLDDEATAYIGDRAAAG
jgi:hypothetical protein